VANKTLSQVIGASNHEIGDIIETKATSLADGRVLLPLDGTIITPASYTELEALLDPGAVATEQPRLYISSNGDSLEDNAANKQADKAFIADDGVRVLSLDDDLDIWFQDAGAAGEEFGTTQFNSYAISNCAGAADGNEILCISAAASGGKQVEGFYTLNGNTFTQATFISGNDATGAYVSAFCARDGANARVVCLNTTDTTIDTYASGTDIGTAWTLSVAYSYTTAPGVTCYTRGSSDDFATMAAATSLGVCCTFNSGTTWTENELLPDGASALQLTVDETDIVWCINRVTQYEGDKLYKTTNGTTWTEMLTASEALSYVSDERVTNIKFLDIFSDSSSNLYMLAAGQWGGGSSVTLSGFLPPLIIFYSEDAGVTWVGHVAVTGVHPQGGNEDWGGYNFMMSPNCDVLMWTGVVLTNPVIRFMDVTTGLALPVLPTKKIVADAP
jgi:hypothetical protein